MDKDKKDFVRIGPGVYQINTSEGLSTAPAHWNYLDNKRDDIISPTVGECWITPKPTQFPVILLYTLNKKTQTIVIKQLDYTKPYHLEATEIDEQLKMDNNPLKDFEKLFPGTYKVLNPAGLTGACLNWGGVTVTQLPKKYQTPLPIKFPITVKFEIVIVKQRSYLMVREVFVLNIDENQVAKPNTVFFQDYPNVADWVTRINNPLVQDLLTNPVLLDQAAGFIDSCAPGTDIAKELRTVARALHDGKPYAICSNDDCVWSDHVDVQEIADYTDCPKCGKLAVIKR